MESGRYYSLELWLTNTFGHDSQGLRVVNAAPDVSRAIRDSAIYGLAVDVLGRIRNHYPNLAVVFRDRNNDSDTGFGANIESLKRLIEIVTLESRAFGSHSHPKPCAVAVLDTMHTFGIENGLVETVPPCQYVYIASEQPMDRDSIVMAATEAADENDLLGRLMEMHSVVLVPGPDNDYITILAVDPQAYSRCGLLKGSGDDPSLP